MAIPVSLADAQRQLRQGGELLDDERAAEITGFIADAAAWVERYTGHILEARDVTVTFTERCAATLPVWPIAASAVPAVTYSNAGAPVAIIGARMDLSRRPARILPPSGASWPLLDNIAQPFTVMIRAGYEPGDAIPGNFRRAMLLLISAYDEDREGGEVFQQAEASARRLCSDYRLRSL